MKTVDIAWLAGLLEGEGCFEFWRTPRLTLGMTDEDTVRRAASLLGGAVYGPTLKPSRKPVWHVGVYGKTAVEWMQTIYLLMGDRRRQKIREVIMGWKSMPGHGSYWRSKTHCAKGHPFSGRNLLLTDGGKKRRCRTCIYTRHKQWYQSDAGKAYYAD